MTEHKPIHDFDDAEAYLERVRAHYRAGHAEYRGRRNEEQQLIAEVTKDEADLIVDGLLKSTLAMNPSGRPEKETFIDDSAEVIGKKSWGDYRNAFGKALVGYGVITNRLERDGYDVPSYANLPEPERMQVAGAAFHDFQASNALRFGVDTAGIKKQRRYVIQDDDGNDVEYVHTSDPDKARGIKDIAQNMEIRDYSTGVAAHTSQKMSPELYTRLRVAYPEIPKDAFDRDASFYTNFEKHLETME